MKGTFVGKLAFAIVAAALIFGSSLCAKAQSADSEKINELFNNIRQHAILAEEDAELLESYTRSRVSWQSHARRIDAMKDHVKELADDFNQASTLRAEGSPWQQDAIDHLRPLLQSMADHITAAIDHLNKNQSRTMMKPWVDYIHANRDFAAKTATLIRDYVSYGESKSAADELEKKLGLAQASEPIEE